MKSNNICVLCITILLAGYNNTGMADMADVVASYMAKQLCSSTMPESTPTIDFTIHDNGTVTHLKTGLMWKRCAEGRVLNDGWWCEDDPDGTTRYTLAETYIQAASVNQEGFAGYTDWRVPNIKELGSIVEVSCTGAMNYEIFPLWNGSNHMSYASSTNAIGIELSGRDAGMDVNHTQATHPTYPNHFYLRLVRSIDE